jgi:hypothetical protein
MKAENPDITQAELQHLFSICSATGALLWKNPRAQRSHAGDRAGSIDAKGYWCVGITTNGKCKLLKNHRIIWAMHHGSWPTHLLDHIDQDKANNRIGNLREATKSLNATNTGLRSTNKSGVKGVYWSGSKNRWVASMTHQNKHYYLGQFTEKSEAVVARKAFELIQINTPKKVPKKSF